MTSLAVLFSYFAVNVSLSFVLSVSCVLLSVIHLFYDLQLFHGSCLFGMVILSRIQLPRSAYTHSDFSCVLLLRLYAVGRGLCVEKKNNILA